MEKKYIEAVAFVPGMGNVKVVFDDVKNLVETGTVTENQTLEFDDVDGHYSFTRTAGSPVWTENNDKAPSLKSYNVICRRTARKHGSVGDGVRRQEVKPDGWKEAEQDIQFGAALGRAFRSCGWGGDDIQDDDYYDEDED